jgi:protein phosphatase
MGATMVKTYGRQQYAQLTDVGCVRQLNEDTVYCSDNLWLIADGMGGHACGDVASQLATRTIVSEFCRNGRLISAIEVAHSTVLEVGRPSPEKQGMGTTIVAMCFHGDEFEIAWVGDSRAYLWQPTDNQLTPLTTDHSLVEDLVQSGVINSLQAKIHPQRNMITRCLGSKDTASFKVDKSQGLWLPQAQVLLCSDGLTDEISETKIVELLQQGNGHEHTLSLLVDAAKEAGGKDNISVILVDSPLGEKCDNQTGR